MSIRVAFLTHYTGLYGANRSLLDLIDGLAVHGVEASVIVPAEGEISRELARREVAHESVPMSWWFQPARPNAALPVTKGDGSALAFRSKDWKDGRQRVLEQLGAWQPDVVYTNSAVISDGAYAARRLDLPHVWHLREFGDLDYELEPRPGWAYARRLIAGSTFTIAVSRSVRRHYRSPHDPSRDRVIDNGVASLATLRGLRRRRDDILRAGRSRARPFTFALLGMLHPGKGHESALQALGQVARHRPELRLLIAGGGDTEPLRRRIAELGIVDLVELRGYFEKPFEVLLDADAALMCSRSEGFGRVTAEAMASGLPVIGHDAGGTPEIVEHEVSGLLYRGGPATIAECMMRFVDDPELAREMGRAGWEIARQRFSIERYAQCVYHVLQQAAEAGEYAAGQPPRADPASSAGSRPSQEAERATGRAAVAELRRSSALWPTRQILSDSDL